VLGINVSRQSFTSSLAPSRTLRTSEVNLATAESFLDDANI